MAAALLDPSAAPAVREFTVIAPGAFDSPAVYAGPGLTLEAVIDEWEEEFRDYLFRFDADRAEGQDAPADLKAYARRWGDMVVWEGGRAVAVLRPHPEGRPWLLVTELEPLAPSE